MNKYVEQLISIGTPYSWENGMIMTYCLNCHFTTALGQEMRVLEINEFTGSVNCKNDKCKAEMNWEKFLEKVSPNKISPVITEAVRETPRENIAPVIIKRPSSLLSLSDILSKEFGEEDWLVESLIPSPSLIALSGSPGDFKTWLTMHIALCVSRGNPVFGKFASKQGNVLMIDEENHPRYLQKRFNSLEGKNDDAISYLSLTEFKADKPEHIQEVLGIIREKNIRLIVLDSLVRIHTKDENDASGMSRVFAGLQPFLKAGVSVVFTHHHRKQAGWSPTNPAQSLRGSSDILAAVDGHISVERKKGEDVILLRQNKARQSEPLPPFEIKIIKNDKGPSNFEYLGQHDEEKKKAQEASEAIINFIKEEGIKSRQDIQDVFSKDFGKGAIDEGIKLAEGQKRLEKVPKDELPDNLKSNSRRSYYRLVGMVDLDDFETNNQESNELPTFPLPI